MKCARTEGGHDCCDGLFERLKEREEGEGDDGGVRGGIPDGNFGGTGLATAKRPRDRAAKREKNFMLLKMVVVDGGGWRRYR
jgi:hypothetical protein